VASQKNLLIGSVPATQNA